jgi:hypothetical protein
MIGVSASLTEHERTLVSVFMTIATNNATLKMAASEFIGW